MAVAVSICLCRCLYLFLCLCLCLCLCLHLCLRQYLLFEGQAIVTNILRELTATLRNNISLVKILKSHFFSHFQVLSHSQLSSKLTFANFFLHLCCPYPPFSLSLCLSLYLIHTHTHTSFLSPSLSHTRYPRLCCLPALIRFSLSLSLSLSLSISLSFSLSLARSFSHTASHIPTVSHTHTLPAPALPACPCPPPRSAHTLPPSPSVRARLCRVSESLKYSTA